MKSMRAVSLTLSLILVMLIAVTCRTVKISESISTKFDSEIVSDTKAKSEVHTDLTDKSKLVDSSTSQDTTSEVIIETEFSAPDSTGRQHVVKTRTTERNSGKRKVNSVIGQKNISQRSDSTGTTINKSKASVKSESEVNRSETVKRKTPLWVWLPVGIVAVGLVVLAYLVLKRYGLVK